MASERETATGAGARSARLWTGFALLAAVATRIPSIFVERPFLDEAAYALIASYWLEGIIPYRDVWDVKPPGLFALYALAIALGAAPLDAVWLLPFAAVCAAVLGFCAIGKVWFGDMRIGALAGALFAWFSLANGGARGLAVIIASPFVIWGLRLARDARSADAFVSGLLLGCAALVLQSTAVEGVLGFLLIAFSGACAAGLRARRALLFVAGGLAPALFFAALLYAQGAFGDMWEAVVLVALMRSVHHGASFWEGLGNNLGAFIRPVLPLLLFSLWTLLSVLVRPRDPLRAPLLIVLAWFALAMAGVTLQHVAYAQYLLPIVAPLCLCAAICMVRLFTSAASFGARVGAGLLAFVALVAPAYWIIQEFRWRQYGPMVRESARLISERRAFPGEGRGLFTGDLDMSLHLLTGEPPVSRFAFMLHLQCSFPLPPGVEQGRELRRAIARAPRFLVRRDPAKVESCTLPQHAAFLDQVVEAAYVLIGAAGLNGEVKVYELRAGMAERLRAGAFDEAP
jgi:hypothetical protein